MFERLFTLILCVFSNTLVHNGQRCRLNTRVDFGEPLPVMIRNGRILEPTDRDGNIYFDFGDTLTLSCEGEGDIIHPETKSQVTTASISCLGGSNFGNDEWLNSPAWFLLFRCPDAPDHQSRRTNRTCFNNHPVIEVGYKIQNEFYPVYESCFDDWSLRPIYSKYTQKPYNSRYQTRVVRPYFIANNDYGDVPVDRLYSPYQLTSTVDRLVGYGFNNYVPKDQMLSRGHLAAKTDFVFAFTERASFHYVNCAPQWKDFNGGNWNTLEVDLRDHVHDADWDTVVYTGTYGVTQLLGANSHRVDVYLTTDENNNPVIPVPQYFYKVVYEPSTRRGIAFIGINNPFYTETEARSLFFCEDVCRGNPAFRWLSWHPDNPSEGYSFCCSVPDFRLSVNHLPPFEVSGLLV